MLELDDRFCTFTDEVAADVARAPWPTVPSADQAPVLNGAVYQFFRSSINISRRRDSGAFFSGPLVSRLLVDLLMQSTPKNAIIMDPTCGVGDLLLAYARELRVRVSLQATLDAWGRQLAGMDVNPHLVRMTKARLVMLARARGQFSEPIASTDDCFPLISVSDFFDGEDRLREADGFLFNPPFGQTSSSETRGWASGRVNSAAIFLDVLLRRKRPSAPVAALLPEVLRCGSRYSRFRSHLVALGCRAAATSIGRFDRWTDVDVFTTLIAEGASGGLWEDSTAASPAMVIGDLFDTRVGPVVPHRHPKRGPWRRFACAKTTPAGALDFEPQNSRRFSGPVFCPPFVTVRRTSSPSDKRRAVGAIIVGPKPVAVENHLIVLIPKAGGLRRCEELMAVLAQAETSDFLNRSIRCRHLTTGAVASIPWTGNV